MLRADAMVLAMAGSAGGTPPRYAVGWRDTNLSAQRPHHGPGVRSLQLLTCHAALILFVFVPLVITVGRMITWPRRIMG
jgi:hypothetical protein